jgi:hypothetical protein
MKYFLILPCIILLSACTAGTKAPEDSTRKIRVYYNNDNIAYLEPCGCRVSPIGGMDRRCIAMRSFPDDARVFVDAGNLLFKSAKASEFLEPQWYEQALGVIEAYNLLGADAVEVGETEFSLGLEKFQELAEKAKFPFISANIYRKGETKTLLRDSVLVRRQGKKIGIFGLFGLGLELPEGLEARDPTEAARRMVKRLREDGADMVIALSHQGYDADVALAKAVPGIDLIVGAHSQSLLQKPDQQGDTLIVQLSNQGQMLGMVEYEAASLPRKRTDFVVSELNSEFNEGPRGQANPMKNLVAVTNLRIREANRNLEEKIWADREKRASETGFDTSIGCRECHAEQAAFHDGKPHSAAFLTLLAANKHFNLDCLKCHSVGMGERGGFESVADAFRDSAGMPVSLDKIRKAAGSGFPKPGVSYRASPARTLADVAHWNAALKKSGVRKSFVSVQCETCHGNLGGHPFNDSHPAKVAISTCVRCHTREQAPTWYGKSGQLLQGKAEAALEKMTCPRREREN